MSIYNTANINKHNSHKQNCMGPSIIFKTKFENVSYARKRIFGGFKVGVQHDLIHIRYLILQKLQRMAMPSVGKDVGNECSTGRNMN